MLALAGRTQAQMSAEAAADFLQIAYMPSSDSVAI